ncbi:MAG: CYTH domain-containing protein [Devosia sp.]
MAIEIERRFRVVGDSWRAAVRREQHIVQGYLATRDVAVIRVRIVDDSAAVITVKSHKTGRSRTEFDYRIPLADAREMLAMAGNAVIDKRRFTLDYAGKVWEIDIFGGRHAGLVIAEIELTAPDETFEHPDWLGDEVTDDPSLANAVLARR